jgi:hypothetical protein
VSHKMSNQFEPEFYQIELRSGTAQDWTNDNPVLGKGEVGFEMDTGKFKIGVPSGLSWNALPYYIPVSTAYSSSSSIPPQRTDMLSAQMVYEVSNFLTWCSSHGVRAYMGEFGFPFVPTPTEGAAPYALIGERARWEGLMERFIELMDVNGVPVTYWDANEYGNAATSAYVYSPSGDYRYVQAGPVNTPTPAGIILERHIGMGAQTAGVAPFRGINYPLGNYGGANSGAFSNMRDTQAYNTAISGTPNTPGLGYNYGSQATAQYLGGRGITVVRLGIRLERLFHGSTPSTPVINATELARLQQALAWWSAAGIQCIIANFGDGAFSLDNGTQGVSTPIGTAGYTVAQFGNMWGLLAQALAGNAGVCGYDVDGEPSLCTQANWEAGAQAACTAIRQHDTNSFVVIETYAGASVFPNDAAPFVTDTVANKLYYSAHFYIDGSGVYASSYDTYLNAAAAAGSYSPDDLTNIRSASVSVTGTGPEVLYSSGGIWGVGNITSTTALQCSSANNPNVINVVSGNGPGSGGYSYMATATAAGIFFTDVVVGDMAIASATGSIRLGFGYGTNTSKLIITPTQVKSPVGVADTTITSGALPTVAPVSGTAFQCSLTRDVMLSAPITYTTAAGSVQVQLSPDGVTYSTVATITPGVSGAAEPVTLIVRAGWRVKLTATNATLNTATYW